jgi:hypothetical protein
MVKLFLLKMNNTFFSIGHNSLIREPNQTIRL